MDSRPAMRRGRLRTQTARPAARGVLARAPRTPTTHTGQWGCSSPQQNRRVSSAWPQVRHPDDTFGSTDAHNVPTLHQTTTPGGNTMRLRWFAIAVPMMLVAAACSSGKASSTGSGGLGTTAPAAGTRPAACSTAQLTSPETGVTPTTITVTVVADVGSPIQPGLFKGSMDAVKAWANYINSNGGLACRNVVVKTVDSQLSARPTRRTRSSAACCELDRAGRHDRAVLPGRRRQIENCKDKAGATTGLPDIAELQTEPDAAVLEAFVRRRCRRARRARTAAPESARSRSATRSTTTTSRRSRT